MIALVRAPLPDLGKVNRSQYAVGMEWLYKAGSSYVQVERRLLSALHLRENSWLGIE